MYDDVHADEGCGALQALGCVGVHGPKSSRKRYVDQTARCGMTADAPSGLHTDEKAESADDVFLVRWGSTRRRIDSNTRRPVVRLSQCSCFRLSQILPRSPERTYVFCLTCVLYCCLSTLTIMMSRLGRECGSVFVVVEVTVHSR